MQNEVTFQAAGVVEVDSPRRRRTQLGGGAHRKAAAWTRSGPNAPPIGFTSSGASLSVPALDSGSCSAGLIIVPRVTMSSIRSRSAGSKTKVGRIGSSSSRWTSSLGDLLQPTVAFKQDEQD